MVANGAADTWSQSTLLSHFTITEAPGDINISITYHISKIFNLQCYKNRKVATPPVREAET